MADTHHFAHSEKMLSPTSLAAMLDISERHLSDVRREDSMFPRPVLLGTLPRWSPDVIRQWMVAQSSDTVDDSPSTPVKPVITATKPKRRAARVH